MEAKRVLLVGNPNVGKSTVFNGLTGLHQHTGNWPGKTVAVAEGWYSYKGREYILTDLPGLYSLDARSQEEQTASAEIRQGEKDCVVVVCDGTCLKRNLILVYQVLEQTENVVVLVNLLDEAKRRGITVDVKKLTGLLGVPVIPGAAGRGEGLEQLKEAVRMISDGYGAKGCRFGSMTRRQRVRLAEETAEQVVAGTDRGRSWILMWDRILTGRKTGIPVMILGLFMLLWVTVAGANIPSEWLWRGVLWIYSGGEKILSGWGAPWWLSGAMLDGMLLTAGRVISVMLPPMAIFFPLFTLLEDLGYLPRVAYNLDHCFERAGGCGKMGLIMCMGLGCNAVGVTGARIIDGQRERILGVITNNLMPCNGRFGGLILLLSGFILPQESGLVALGLLGLLVLSFIATMIASKILCATILRGMPSGFVLELPPYRRPRVMQVLVRSLLDRTLLVLGRAAVVAFPAGLVLWGMSQLSLGGEPLLMHMAGWLDPVAGIFGLNGVILLAFLLGTPANEIVLPMVLLILSGSFGYAGESLLPGLVQAGMDMQTALCTAMLFLFHWPCATTILTIVQETRNVRWIVLGILLPTAMGLAGCLCLRLIFLLLG